MQLIVLNGKLYLDKSELRKALLEDKPATAALDGFLQWVIDHGYAGIDYGFNTTTLRIIRVGDVLWDDTGGEYVQYTGGDEKYAPGIVAVRYCNDTELPRELAVLKYIPDNADRDLAKAFEVLLAFYKASLETHATP